MSKSRVLFFVTGSIAAFKAAAVVSRLVQDGCEVQCVLSPSALRFVGEATFEGLTGKRVLTDLWEPGRAMDHIHLSRWADFGVVCPASANTIAQMALGLADGVVASTLLAWPRSKPLYVFPAMNSEMLAAAPVQSHINSLRSRGVLVAESGSGSLACGEEGDGRLLEPDEILRILRQEGSGNGSHLPVTNAPTAISPKILITSGATREPIDGIRFITNHSTGRTGSELAELFTSAGWSVTLLHGQGAVMPRLAAIRPAEFSSHGDLNEKLRSELGTQDYAAVIHCAAVADYTIAEVSHPDSLSSSQPKNILEHKIQSGEDLILHLAPTAKILPSLREFSRNKNIKVIGFKLTLNSSKEDMLAAAEKILGGGVDAVVANDWAQVSADRTQHPGFVCSRTNSGSPARFASVPELARLLAGLLPEPHLAPKETNL